MCAAVKTWLVLLLFCPWKGEVMSCGQVRSLMWRTFDQQLQSSQRQHYD
jgi:hypothetical protein